MGRRHEVAAEGGGAEKIILGGLGWPRRRFGHSGIINEEMEEQQQQKDRRRRKKFLLDGNNVSFIVVWLKKMGCGIFFICIL